MYFVMDSILVIFTQGVDVGQSHNPVGVKEEYFKAKSRKNANVDRRKKYETFITKYCFIHYLISKKSRLLAIAFFLLLFMFILNMCPFQTHR